MKSILYVGATLMIGASIYGFVDYQRTSHKKEFTDMYKEKEVTGPVKTVDARPDDLVGREKTAIVTDKNDVVAKEEKAAVTSEKKETKKVVKKKKRKLDAKLFSRGALDERYIDEEIKLDAPKEKKEAVKNENKEQ